MSRLRVSRFVAERIGRSRSDIIMQTFRAGGSGGQNQNKRDSGVRLIDKITGLRAESREQRSQDQNRKAAWGRLVELMLAHYRRKELEARQNLPPMETVRTYKFPKHFVVDHRTGGRYDLATILGGDLDQLHRDLMMMEKKSV